MTKKHPYLRDKLSLEKRATFQRGTDVGVLAQQVFPGGINMAPNAPSQFPKRVAQTMDNLQNASVDVLYEAVFQYNDTLIMVDIMVRDGDGWKAIEVKSSLKLSTTYYQDAALQYYVLKGCGVPLTDMQLMHLNGGYVKEGPIDVHQLFQTVSVMDYAKEHVDEIAANVERLKNVVALPHSPLVNIGMQCHMPYDCDFLGHCWKMVPKNSFLYTTALPDEALFDYYFGGVGTNEALLQRLDPDSEEACQVEALQSNSYYIDYKTLFALAPNPKPHKVACLNLLLYRPAIPELDGTRPYQEMMLAFALTGEEEPGGSTVWNCFDDHSRWREGIEVLEARLTHYDLTVTFTPMANLGYKVFNLYQVLAEAHLFHPALKSGFNLQHLAEALFNDVKLFENSRILAEATSNDLTSYEQAKDDLLAENKVIMRIYKHFFN